MSREVTNATQLMPIVKKSVRALYGEKMQNTRILKADRTPLFREPKQGWMIHTEFNDEDHEYSVQMDIQIADGRITRSIELHRHPLKE